MYKVLTALLLLISLSVVAQQPTLKGGLASFVKTNTIYPKYSFVNCIQGTVNIGFKLNAKGEVYASSVRKGIGTDLDDEALRLIRMSSKKWDVPSSHDTTSLLVVPINFALNSQDCRTTNARDIALAIKNYKDEEELIKVIKNFYQNKEKGIAKAEDEPRITRIKNDLGIDDEYLYSRINAGLKKIKQGDKQGACEDFNFVKYIGSGKANDLLLKHCN